MCACNTNPVQFLCPVVLCKSHSAQRDQHRCAFAVMALSQKAIEVCEAELQFRHSSQCRSSQVHAHDGSACAHHNHVRLRHGQRRRPHVFGPGDVRRCHGRRNCVAEGASMAKERLRRYVSMRHQQTRGWSFKASPREENGKINERPGHHRCTTCPPPCCDDA